MDTSSNSDTLTLRRIPLSVLAFTLKLPMSVSTTRDLHQKSSEAMPPAPEPALHLYRSTKGGMGISH